MDESLKTFGTVQFCAYWSEDDVEYRRECAANGDEEDSDEAPDSESKVTTESDRDELKVGLNWLPINVGWASTTMYGRAEDSLQQAFIDRRLWVKRQTKHTWYAEACVAKGLPVDVELSRNVDGTGAVRGESTQAADAVTEANDVALPSRPKD